MKLRNSSISARVALAFASVLFIVVALGAVSIDRLSVVNGHAAEVRDNFLPSGPILHRMSNALTRMRAQENQQLLKGKGVDLADLKARFAKSIEEVKKARVDFEPLIDKGTDEEKN